VHIDLHLRVSAGLTAVGTKRTCGDRTRMSAFGGKADSVPGRAFPLMTLKRHRIMDRAL
jgi:hypothetical protein